MAEYRVSIYGRKQSEWDQLASWFINNSIYSDNAVWLIQVRPVNALLCEYLKFCELSFLKLNTKILSEEGRINMNTPTYYALAFLKFFCPQLRKNN